MIEKDPYKMNEKEFGKGGSQGGCIITAREGTWHADREAYGDGGEVEQAKVDQMLQKNYSSEGSHAILWMEQKDCTIVTFLDGVHCTKSMYRYAPKKYALLQLHRPLFVPLHHRAFALAQP